MLNKKVNYEDANRQTLDRKGYGRIYVEKEEDIEKVKQIIKELDEFEYGYIPDDLIAVFDYDNLKSTFTHKFCDLNMNILQAVCWNRGIKIFVWYGRLNNYYDL